MFFIIKDSLPIFFENDAPCKGSWLYLSLILTPLKVSRAVILLLKTILWGLLFGHLELCVTINTEASRNCWVIYLKAKHLHEHCIHNESWLNNNTEKVWHFFFLSLHFIAVVDNVFFILSLFPVAILILMGFHISYAHYLYHMH